MHTCVVLRLSMCSHASVTCDHGVILVLQQLWRCSAVILTRVCATTHRTPTMTLTGRDSMAPPPVPTQDHALTTLRITWRVNAFLSSLGHASHTHIHSLSLRLSLSLSISLSPSLCLSLSLFLSLCHTHTSELKTEDTYNMLVLPVIKICHLQFALCKPPLNCSWFLESAPDSYWNVHTRG